MTQETSDQLKEGMVKAAQNAMKLVTQIIVLSGLLLGVYKYVLSANETAQRAESKADQALREKADKEDVKQMKDDIRELRKEFEDFMMAQQHLHH